MKVVVEGNAIVLDIGLTKDEADALRSKFGKTDCVIASRISTGRGSHPNCFYVSHPNCLITTKKSAKK